MDFPQKTSLVLGLATAFDLSDYISDSLFVDPQFAGVAEAARAGESVAEFPVETLMRPTMDIDFDSFFTTDPELVERGTGLQPEAFAEFRFDKAAH